jgi:hypothetical protein
VIRLGLRLTLRSGREALVRLAVTAAAVALGVGLLFITVSGTNALRAQDARTAWLNTSPHNVRPSVDEATTDPLWGTASLDQFKSQSIDRIDVAATGPRSPIPPGLPRLPGPGEFFASPELSRLLRSTPAAELADRYPGHQVGTIGPSALASPKSLTIVIGHTVDELAQRPGAAQVRSIETAPDAGEHQSRLEFILAIVAGALLFPVLIFIATATRLAAARREQRFAAMRLVGATPRQISVVAAVEGWIAAAVGVVAGIGLFYLGRPALAAVPFSGQPFFPADLSLHWSQIGLVAVGVPVAAALAAALALRRVRISPLGVSRRVTPVAPRAWRVLPLLAGLAEFAWFVRAGTPGTTGRQIAAYGTGFVVTLAGLIVAGPWLTMVGSRVLARRAARPATLIAGRRLADNPRAAFRAVSGLIVALFVASSAFGVIASIVAQHNASTGGKVGRDIVTEDFMEGYFQGQPEAAPSDAVLARLRAVPGVRGVAVMHTEPFAGPTTDGPSLGPPSNFASCADLAAVPALGRCDPGADVAKVPPLPVGAVFTRQRPGGAQIRPAGGGVSRTAGGTPVWPAAALSADQLARLPMVSLYVATDGSSAAIEGTRTALEASFPQADLREPPTTIGDISPHEAQLLAGWRRLADVAIVASLVIAACSLAVSVVAGLNDRKRPFSLLRLTGAPLGVLRRVVALEAAVPLVVIAALSAGTGLLAAKLFLRAQLNQSLSPPGAEYYAIVLTGLAVSLGIIAATLPLLERITGPEVARND